MSPKTWSVIRREYFQVVRRKAFLFGTLFTPLFFALFVLLPPMLLKRSEGVVNLAILDRSGTEWARWGQAFAEQRLSGGEAKYQLRELPNSPQALSDAREAVRDKKLSAVLVIPEDFPDSCRAELQTRSITDLLLQDEIRQGLSTVLRNVRMERRGITAEVINAIVRPAQLDVASVLEVKQKSTEAVIIVAYVFVILLYMTLIMYGTSIMNSVIEDKITRVYEVMLSCVTARDLLLGKVLGVGLASLTQYGIWTVAFFVITAVRPIPQLQGAHVSAAVLAAFLGLGIFGYLVYALLYAGLGSICSSTQDAQQVHWPLIICLAGPMAIAFPILMRPDGPLAVILSLIPLTSPTIMSLRLGVTSPGPIQVGLCFLLLAALALFAYYLSGKVFRVAIMVHGKRPPWRQVVRWLFEQDR